MTTATERVPILVTKADKAKFARKAKSFWPFDQRICSYGNGSRRSDRR